MIALPAGTQIWIAAGITDLRRGFDGLSAIVQTVLKENPFSGQVFVFRGRRGDLIKVLWWDDDGLPICEAAGEGTFHLAESGKQYCRFDASTVIDAIGRHRLAAAAADTCARSLGISKRAAAR